MRKIWLVATMVVALLVGGGTALAVAGDLDTTFGGGDGKVVNRIGDAGVTRVEDAIVLPDGKKMVLGYTYRNTGPSNPSVVIARFGPLGGPDRTFGGGDGKVEVEDFSYGYDLEQQPDGRLIVSGEYADPANSGQDFALARYNSDGTLDSTFGGGDGLVATDVSPSDDPTERSGNVRELVVQPDKKLVAVGVSQCNNGCGDFALARYNSDGTPDSTFGGGDGTVVTDLGPFLIATSVVLQPDGKVVVAGGSDPDYFKEADATLARYNANGTLDTSFSDDGKVSTDLGSQRDYANDLVLQPDGKLVLGGKGAQIVNGRFEGTFTLARYNANGALDTSFDGDGKVHTRGINGGIVTSLLLRPDGKLVAAGEAFNNVVVARYWRGGALDYSFSGDGKTLTYMKEGSVSMNALVSDSGKLLTAGDVGGIRCADPDCASAYEVKNFFFTRYLER